MIDIVDTLKTSGIGMGGWWLSISGWLPEVIAYWLEWLHWSTS